MKLKLIMVGFYNALMYNKIYVCLLFCSTKVLYLEIILDIC